MNKQIIDNLRRGYDAFSRGDIQGAIDAVDPDPDILWSEPESFYAGGIYRGRQGVAEYLTLSYEASEKVQTFVPPLKVPFLPCGSYLLCETSFSGPDEPRGLRQHSSVLPARRNSVARNWSTHRLGDDAGEFLTIPLAKVSSLVMVYSTNSDEMVYSRLVAPIAKMAFRSPINRDGLAKCSVQHLFTPSVFSET